MKHAALRFGCVLVLAVVCAACGKKPQAEPTPGKPVVLSPTETSEKAETVAKTDPVEQPISAIPQREATRGRWTLVISPGTPNHVDISILLLDITQDSASQADGVASYKVKLIGSASIFPETVLTGSKVTDDSVELSFNMVAGNGAAPRPFDFIGTLKDKVVRGNIQIADAQYEPARLIPTEDKNADGYEKPKPSLGRDVLKKLSKAKDPVAIRRAFYQHYKISPIALDLFDEIFAMAGRQHLDAATVEEIVTEYRQAAKLWGPRIETMSLFNIGFSLCRTKYLPDLGLKYLGQAETRFSPKMKKRMQPLFELARDKAAIAKVQEQAVAAGKVFAAAKKQDAAKKQNAVKQLRKLQKSHPLDPVVTYTLASCEASSGHVDKAVELYAAIAVVPMMNAGLLQSPLFDRKTSPLPRQEMVRLWKTQHKDDKELKALNAYLPTVYKKSIERVGDAASVPNAASLGNRVVLGELFTGTMCAPCVSADMALAGLEHVYPETHLIILQYHQHIGQNPLANVDSLGRAARYRLRATPSLLFNGEPPNIVGGVGGFLEDVPRVYRQLNSILRKKVVEKTETTLQLKATAANGRIALSATVGGLKTVSDDLRLVTVLAEDEIEFPASNGIRLHELVVRGMPGGVEGVAPKNGRLQYEQSLDLGKFKQKIVDHLDDFEATQGAHFRARPMKMQQMHFVAFVQNRQTGEILQAASVPVVGELVYPKISKSVLPDLFDGDKTAKPPKTTTPKTTTSNGKPAQATKPKTTKPASSDGPKLTPPKTTTKTTPKTPPKTTPPPKK